MIYKYQKNNPLIWSTTYRKLISVKKKI
ncbi:unnamed protein product [Spirodela intermedia]|uniref:Uncharacterized protein n=1 Tax=Spirodela intermedia TaxID=51605 RepID=A0A7I8KEH4_SPIIN|nr:unnamed protein product [Spirodela intermedia]